MKKNYSEDLTLQIIFLALLIFLSRIPFLWAGFGAEEDSWLLALTAKNISLSSAYQMSRAPGHPLQEFLYAMLYNKGLSAFTTNLVSAIASVIATVFFALSIRNLGLKHYLFSGFAFAFTPIIFVSSTYTIDYMLAMAFVMGSFYFITTPPCPSPKGRERTHRLLPLWGRLERGWIWAAIFLGIAIGFRLTSAAMILPFIILLYPSHKGKRKGIFLFVLATCLIGGICYLPVVKTYGLSFFTYSDQFPYPNLPKVFYKLTFGVFGTIGLITILCLKISILIKKFRSKEKMIPSEMPATVFWASFFVIIIYMISYFRLPQKSAYFIPAVPFIILMFRYYLSDRRFKILCVLMAMSSFLFSINLTDSLRGSIHSPAAMKFSMAGQEIFVDPLTGSIFSDYTKRLNKIAYTEEVFQKISHEQQKTVLICGWWFNELQVRNWEGKENANVKKVFYIDQAVIEKYISEGYGIYYLPEQNLYNDQFSGMNYTDSTAKPYMEIIP